MYLTPAEAARFASKYVAQANGCWQWQLSLDRDGYGTFYFRRRSRRAHRVGWYSLYGEIPPGMVINHKCGQRSCVNPQHLDLTTVRENALRDSRSIAAVNARKTTCPQGHPYDAQYRTRNGTQRYCRRCEAVKKVRLRRKWVQEDTLSV